MAKVNVEVGVNAAPFRRGLQEVEASTSKLRDKLAKNFGGQGIGRAFVAAFGLSLEGIADKITTPWKKAAEHAKDILEYSERATKLFESRMSGRRTDEQNLEVENKRVAAIGKTEESLSQEKLKLEAQSFLPGIAGAAAMALNVSRIREIEVEIARIGVEREESLARQAALTKKIADAKAAERAKSKAEVDEILGMREERRKRNLQPEDLKASLEESLKELDGKTDFFSLKLAETILKELDDVTKIVNQRALTLDERITTSLSNFFDNLDEASTTTTFGKKERSDVVRVDDLTRIGGGRLFGAGGSGEPLVQEAKKHTALLTTIRDKLAAPSSPRFTT